MLSAHVGICTQRSSDSHFLIHSLSDPICMAYFESHVAQTWSYRAPGHMQPDSPIDNETTPPSALQGLGDLNKPPLNLGCVVCNQFKFSPHCRCFFHVRLFIRNHGPDPFLPWMMNPVTVGAQYYRGYTRLQGINTADKDYRTKYFSTDKVLIIVTIRTI